MSIKVVELLIKYEQSIEKLYSTCAVHFPEYSSFWDKLAAEEARHEQII